MALDVASVRLREPALTRRGFLRGAGSATLASAAVTAGGLPLAASAAAQGAGPPRAPSSAPSRAEQRRAAAQRKRFEAAHMAFGRPLPVTVINNEEADYGGKRLGNFSKGLPHNSLGEVDPSA